MQVAAFHFRPALLVSFNKFPTVLYSVLERYGTVRYSTGTTDRNIATKLSTYFFLFNFHGSVHCNNILIYIQQDATLHSLFYLETV